MRALIKLLLLLLFVVVVGILGVGWFALSEEPLVAQQPLLTHSDIAAARRVLQKHDPQNLPSDEPFAIAVSEQDLNLAANYLLQRFANGGARLTLADRSMRAVASIRIPRLPQRATLNIAVLLRSNAGKIEIAQLSLGRITIPGAMARAAIDRAMPLIAGTDRVEAFRRLVDQVRFQSERMEVDYRWDPQLLDKARDTLLTTDDQAALRHYLDVLLDLQANGAARRGSLTGTLSALFEAARLRSQQHDPVAENVALLTLLGTWASQQDTRRLVAGSTRNPGYFALKIARRNDFARHFLASAALAARGDSTLSDAVGLFKEISDTDRGSGFSFADIAADRAGSRFGALATRSAADARRLQQRMAAGVTEADIMPHALDLPENMRGEAFQQRFGHVGSAAYRQVMAQIEKRINALPLYRD
jgi:hypothetical protein